MTRLRRLILLLLPLAVLAASPHAAAQAFPNKPIRLIVADAAGSHNGGPHESHTPYIRTDAEFTIPKRSSIVDRKEPACSPSLLSPTDRPRPKRNAASSGRSAGAHAVGQRIPEPGSVKC